MNENPAERRSDLKKLKVFQTTLTLKILPKKSSKSRLTLEKFIVSTPTPRSMKKQNREKILDLFGQWDGEVNGFLHDFYERRQKRGRLE